MSQSQGLMSDDQLNALHTKLLDVLGNCPVCCERDWLIHPEILVDAVYNGIDLQLRLNQLFAAPKIRLTCRNCGNLLYFSASALGVIPLPDETND